MGQLVEGRWQRGPLLKNDEKGRFVRQSSGFRGALRANGEAGPDGRRFAVEAGRYHLYVSYACPFAHRVLLVRALRGLEGAIDCDVVQPLMGEDGWSFDVDGAVAGAPPRYVDRLHHRAFLHQVYQAADPQHTGRVTVPVLWDTQHNTIVNNDSAELMRMLDGECDTLATRPQKVCLPAGLMGPDPLSVIDALNQEIEQRITGGVYRCGFASQQQAYEQAFDELFAALAQMDARLATRRFLLGAHPCESDWRLFTTLVRFDAVYVSHFRCNQQRIEDFAHLSGYLCDLFAQPHVEGTVHIDHIKAHYFLSHKQINPRALVPKGPQLAFLSPRARHLAVASRQQAVLAQGGVW